MTDVMTAAHFHDAVSIGPFRQTSLRGGGQSFLHLVAGTDE